MDQWFHEALETAKSLFAFVKAEPGVAILLFACLVGLAWAKSKPGWGARL